MATVPSLGFADRNVGDIVAEDYTRAAIFKQFGLDFCCGGGRPLAEACVRAGVDLTEVERQLARGSRGSQSAGDWLDPSDWDLPFLMDYIVQVHHRYVLSSLPVLSEFSSKVARVHGEANPSLVTIRDLVSELADSLEIHLHEEESVLFPQIRALAGDAATPNPGEPLALGDLEDDHTHAGDLMRQLRELTNDFTPPAQACATWRGCWAKLEEFETDLHRHVHLENNVLFPRALAIRGGDLAGVQ